ncbi:MAG: Eco57I restriction-modification methylase domain-containing protein [Bryobacteraceae bacterium]
MILDDGILSSFILDLSSEDSPYLFSTIPIHILGSVYERFLSKVIRITPGGLVRVEEKPEVRKAGGVYYTPRYIVNHIVNETVGRILNGKAPADISTIRIADPACGSGSFLIRAFERICEYYLEWLVANPSKQNKKLCHRDSGNALLLTTGLKRKILIENIYGIDVDPQAVEVTQLSLYLKILEGETRNSMQAQRPLFPSETFLPDLSRNIQCGNSLIGMDIMNLFIDHSEMDRIRPFDWEEAFPKVFGRGGFDVVIGNPPYLYSAGQEYKEYFESHFSLDEYQTDFYVFFIEQALRKLKRGGSLGFIISDSWIKGKHFSRLRTHLVEHNRLRTVVVFEYTPFKGAAIENSIIVVEKRPPADFIDVYAYENPDTLITLNKLRVADVVGKPHIDIHFLKETADILAKMEKGNEPLLKFCLLNRGVHAYRTDGYGKSKFGSGYQTKRDKAEQSYHATTRVNKSFLPEIKGKHLFRYGYNWDGTYLSYGDWLAEARRPEFFLTPKLAIRKIIGARLVCTFIKAPVVLDQSIYVAIERPGCEIDLRFLLGILGSAVGAWYLRVRHGIYDTLYPWFTKEQLATLPVPHVDLETTDGERVHDHLVRLVDRMLGLQKKLKRTSGHADVTHLQRLLRGTDTEIDRAVFALYGLSEHQKRTILSAISKSVEAEVQTGA